MSDLSFVRQAAARATGTSVTTTLAATPTVGDLLVASCVVEGINQSFTMPTGWAQLVAHAGAGNSNAAAIYWKIAGAGEPTAVTLTTSGTAANLNVSEWLPTATPHSDVSSSADSNNVAVSSQPSGATPTPGGRDGLAIAVLGETAVLGSPTVDSGYTLLTTTPRMAAAYKLLTGQTSQSCTFTWTPAARASAVIGLFYVNLGAAVGFTGWGIPI